MEVKAMRRSLATLALLGFAGALSLLAGPAAAQQACLLRDTTVTRLEERYGERVLGRGLANAGTAMFELFVSETGSWTVVVSDPKGRSCVVASGEDWQQLPLKQGDPVALQHR